MTRFARAKGSKSSNSREAEDATQWHDFKRQDDRLQASSASVNDHNDTIVKKAFEKIRQVSQTDTVWADFGVPQSKPSPKMSKKRNASDSGVDTELQGAKKKKKKGHSEKSGLGEEIESTTKASPVASVPQAAEKKKKKVHAEKSSEDKELESSTNSPSVENGFTGAKLKKKTRTQQFGLDEEPKPSPVEAPSSVILNEAPSQVKQKKKKKNKKDCDDTNQPEEHQKNPDKTGNKNGATFKRRKPFVPFSTVTINGLSINVAKFDGFDVKHEDAIRLQETRAKMLKANIPRDEINLAIKRERRNAEKALAREKKKVCFNCRKSGHSLSDCPELGSSGSKNIDSIGTNICYKCGSTEHTHFQCQVKKKKEYSFATCFICKEQGHISSQCPDNPRGLYPQGGCCKVCGEVTHLKKDCPQISKERSESAVTLDTIAPNSNVESLGEEVQPFKSVKKAPVRQNKVVKF